MVLNAAVQLLKEADDLKQKIINLKSGTSLLHDKNIWTTQQQLQKIYQKVLILDLDYALEKKVEQDLWNVGFKQQIEALQAISKDRKNPSRSEGQAMLAWVLQAAAGFYLCLMHQICTTFKLDLPFRRRASLLGCVEGWGVGKGRAAAAAARYLAQHCLVHLGDLARYRYQLRVAHTFYRHAVAVWSACGQPYNQLALVSWRRGKRLCALYWHVRSVLARAPFPPALHNLQKTLAVAANVESKPALPVLSGLAPPRAALAAPRITDSHQYVNEFIRVTHLLHTVDDLETASQLVNSLNSSLTALVATGCFETNTLIKMSCIVIWLVHSCTEDLSVPVCSLSADEQLVFELSCSLAAGAMLAVLLPAYTAPVKHLAALKVWLQWLVSQPSLLSSAAVQRRPQLWPALQHTLQLISGDVTGFRGELYETLPLPEDEELHGFLPLEEALSSLRFKDQQTWDTFGDRLPHYRHHTADDTSDTDSAPSELRASALSSVELQSQVRRHRLLQLVCALHKIRPDLITVATEDDQLTFTVPQDGDEQLTKALEELSLAAADKKARTDAGEDDDDNDDFGDSDDEKPPPPPPIVISEADFREKVREKRVGILKPQGSLERAREERASLVTNTQEEEEESESQEEQLKSNEAKKESSKKARMNVAMAAIMRKQEESNKQVKFVTPPPTPESLSVEPPADKKPPAKVLKSLANLPVGRKTGGILSLKDKSAGYPHLVNVEPDAAKKTDKDDKKDPKPNQTNQPYMKKEQPPNWPNAPANAPANITVQTHFNDGPRFGLQKNSYGPQSPGLYNSNYQNANNQGIRLPVVNPKEIDVRSAALQKQSSRQDLYPDKFGQSYQMSGDKKNFLNDLPPRFANQYRHWQNSQETQMTAPENTYKSEFQPNSFAAPPRSSWPPPPADSFQPPPWWKADNPPLNYNYSNPMNAQPNFYMPNMSNPYQNMPSYNQMPNQGAGQGKADGFSMAPGYLQANMSQPPPSSGQGVGSLPSYGTYSAPMSYDASMYPQFSKLGYPQPPPKTDKPLPYGHKDDMPGLGFGTGAYNDKRNDQQTTNMDQAGGAPSSYSLFSAAHDGWGAPRHTVAQQSLWSGPGPSPLERLLEQQKVTRPPPTEPQ